MPCRLVGRVMRRSAATDAGSPRLARLCGATEPTQRSAASSVGRDGTTALRRAPRRTPACAIRQDLARATSCRPGPGARPDVVRPTTSATSSSSLSPRDGLSRTGSSLAWPCWAPIRLADAAQLRAYAAETSTPSLASASFAASCSAAFFDSPRADAELLAVDHRRAREAPVVRRALDLEHRVVHRLAPARERLLQLGLVVDVARQRVLDPARERLRRSAARSSRSRARGRARRARPRAARRARCGCATSRSSSSAGMSAPRSAQLARRARARARRPRSSRARRRASGSSRAGPRVKSGIALVERARDRELEHAVAEELEPLVRRRAVGAQDACVKTCSARAVGQAARSASRARRRPRVGGVTGATRRSRRPARRS